MKDILILILVVVCAYLHCKLTDYMQWSDELMDTPGVFELWEAHNTK